MVLLPREESRLPDRPLGCERCSFVISRYLKQLRQRYTRAQARRDATGLPRLGSFAEKGPNDFSETSLQVHLQQANLNAKRNVIDRLIEARNADSCFKNPVHDGLKESKRIYEHLS